MVIACSRIINKLYKIVMKSSTIKLIIGALLIFSVIQGIALWSIIKLVIGGYLILEYLRGEKEEKKEVEDFFV